MKRDPSIPLFCTGTALCIADNTATVRASVGTVHNNVLRLGDSSSSEKKCAQTTETSRSNIRARGELGSVCIKVKVSYRLPKGYQNAGIAGIAWVIIVLHCYTGRHLVPSYYMVPHSFGFGHPLTLDKGAADRSLSSPGTCLGARTRE